MSELTRNVSEDLFAEEYADPVGVVEVEAVAEEGNENNVAICTSKRRRGSRDRRMGRPQKRRRIVQDRAQVPPTSVQQLEGNLEALETKPAKRKYNKQRKGQILTLGKKHRQSKWRCVEKEVVPRSVQQMEVETLATDRLEANLETVPEENVEIINIKIPAKRQYNTKRKSQSLTMGKKSKGSKRLRVEEEVMVADPLDTSAVLCDLGDGEDHQEYGFLNLSPNAQQANDYVPSSQQSSLSMEDFPSETSAVEALVYSLSRSFKESGSEWKVDSRGDMCRITLLNDSPNVAVQRAVVWSSNSEIQVFFNNKALPADNFLLDIPQPDSTIPNIATYLQQVVTVVEGVRVCEGVTTFTSCWKAAEEVEIGQVEKSCFRSTQCPLIHIESKRCDACESARLSFKQKKWRDAHAKRTDLKKMNNRYLLRKALLAKTKKLASEKKIANKTIRYYKKRIRKMIKSESVSLDPHLSKEFFNVMKQNVAKMTPVQKLFWSEQVKAISKQANPRAVRWNPMMIKIALHLQSLSPAAYEYMRESGILKLPSQRRLYDFSHFTKATEGVQHAVLDLLCEKLNKIITDDYQRLFNVLFDEMNIRSGLVVTKSGELVGFVNLTEIEEAVADLEADLGNEAEVPKQEAKKVLVFMLQGICIDVHEVVAIFPTTDLTAEQLYPRAWDVIFNLESRNMKVLTLIGDGAGCNKNFFKMHTKYDDSQDFVYSTRNLASGEDRPLFFIVDPPHLLKTIRNCFSNSYGHSNTRKMWKDGAKISWEAIEILMNATIKDKFKKHKLTWAHVKLTAFTRMNVKYATQTMSGSTSLSLEDYKHDERFEGLINSELITFISVVNNFFDCLNGSNDPDGRRNKSNKLLLPYTSVNDERLRTTLPDVLQFFKDWKSSVDRREGGFTTEEREKMGISSQSYDSLHITIFGFCGAVKYLLDSGAPSIDAKKFNQDKLEQYFGILRMGGGANNNPSCQEVVQKNLTITVQKGAALPAKKGNTKGDRQLVVDEEALPCRPRRKV